MAADGTLLLVAVPTLLAGAAGILLMRLLPVTARGLLAIGGTEWSTPVVTGLRRIVRRPTPATLPVLAVTVAAATVVLTTATVQTVQRTLDTAAWFEIVRRPWSTPSSGARCVAGARPPARVGCG
ncbi:MAG TPA: hypothetical protein VK923_01130 [Euzebyales bacterium]|nr:hypothetical protein [Euzebyales bacterium]